MPVIPVLQNVNINFVFGRRSVFELETGTKRTDRQTDGRARPVMRPIKRPHISDKTAKNKQIMTETSQMY